MGISKDENDFNVSQNVSDMGYTELSEYIVDTYLPYIKEAQKTFTFWNTGFSYDFEDKNAQKEILEYYKDESDYTESELTEKTNYRVKDWEIVRVDTDEETGEEYEEELEELSADNTYNGAYLGLVDLNWRVYHDTEFDKYFYIIHPHLGGDIRGNYGEAFILEGDDRDDLFYRFYDGFVSGGLTVYIKMKDAHPENKTTVGSTLIFDSQQDSDVAYFEFSEYNSEINSTTAQSLVDDFESYESWQGDEFLERIVDIYNEKKPAKKYMGGGYLDDSPRIYVEILGTGTGNWMDLDGMTEGYEVMEAIQEFIDEYNEAKGGSAEEYRIADMEGFGHDYFYNPYMSESDFDQLLHSYSAYEESDYPAELIFEYANDNNLDVEDAIRSMEDSYYGAYDEMSDFAYQMVSEGLYTPSGSDVYVTDTDKRIISGEEADSIIDNMDNEQIIDESSDGRRTYNSKEHEIESKIEELKDEISSLEDLQAESENDEDYDNIADTITDKESEIEELEEALGNLEEEIADDVRQEVYDDIYERTYYRLENDLEDWLSEYGYEDYTEVNFLVVDYDSIADYLASDYMVYEADGKHYFFINYKGGGKIKSLGKPKDFNYYIIEKDYNKIISGHNTKKEALSEKANLKKEHKYLNLDVYPMTFVEMDLGIDTGSFGSYEKPETFKYGGKVKLRSGVQASQDEEMWKSSNELKHTLTKARYGMEIMSDEEQKNVKRNLSRVRAKNYLKHKTFNIGGMPEFLPPDKTDEERRIAHDKRLLTASRSVDNVKESLSGAKNWIQKQWEEADFGDGKGKAKFTLGGYVKGDEVLFRYNGKTRKGTITDELGNGEYAIFSGSGFGMSQSLVKEENIEGYAPAYERRKFLGIFNDGGQLRRYDAVVYFNDINDKTHYEAYLHIHANTEEQAKEIARERFFSEDANKFKSPYVTRVSLRDRGIVENKNLDVLKALKSKNPEERKGAIKSMKGFDGGGEIKVGDIYQRSGYTMEVLEILSENEKTIKVKALNTSSTGMKVVQTSNIRKSTELKKIGSAYAGGGSIEKQNKSMLENDAVQIEHHSEELNKVVPKTNKVPAWVIGKTSRINSDLSDVTHYLDGRSQVKKKFDTGGTLELSREKAKKVFHLPYESAIYVPSTSNVDEVISPEEMDSRVQEVQNYLGSLFGGFSSAETMGGFVDSTGKLVNEDIIKVTSFAEKDAFNQNKEEVLNKLADWSKQWGQEAMGFEFEGDLYYVPANYKQGGELWIQNAVKEMDKKGTKGAFTKQAKRHGMTPKEFAKEVESNPSKYRKKTRQRANFVENVASFDDGGWLSDYLYLEDEKFNDGGGVDDIAINDIVSYMEGDDKRTRKVADIKDNGNIVVQVSKEEFLELSPEEIVEVKAGKDTPVDIITKKIGLNKELAEHFIGKSRKFGVWLADIVADDIVKEHKQSGRFPENMNDKELLNELFTKVQRNPVQYIETTYGSQITGILDWLNFPMTANVNIKEMDFKEAVRRSVEWHKQLEASGETQNYVEPESNRIIKEYKPDENDITFYWALLPTRSCTIESKRMGHCGTTSRGNALISLRYRLPTKGGNYLSDSKVTIAWNSEDGVFYQIKGTSNQPAKEFNIYNAKYDVTPFIYDLIMTMISLEDTEEKRVNELIEQKVEERKKRYETEKQEALKSVEKAEKLIAKIEQKIDDPDIDIDEMDKLEEEILRIRGQEKANYRKIDVIDVEYANDVKEIKETLGKYKLNFNGFGREHADDWRIDSLSLEQKSKLFELKPNLELRESSDIVTLYNEGAIPLESLKKRIEEGDDEELDTFTLQKTLWEAGLVNEEPTTIATVSIDIDDLSRVLDTEYSDDTLANMITGEDTYEWFDGAWGYYYENASDFIDELNKENQQDIIDYMVEKSDLTKKEIKENGITYYLEDDEYADEDFVDEIKRAIASSLTASEEGAMLSYYYEKIKDALEELGEVKQLNDEGLILEVDVSNHLSDEDIDAYWRNVGSDMEGIFIEALYSDIDKPSPSIDDRYSDRGDINDYWYGEIG